ncbi:uncharacterized protein BN648_00795 [Clostridium sp. CAG:411]|jgi:stage III sporulation protein AH|nr:SpoIIIAH-like family protein [Lachnospiraceae bacterium]CDE47285.1 uncharacterized protein BN648_00795 [Clostridium sp. CAG:411]
MKHIWKRNQIIITALVIMVGVAGYLNFTDNSVKETLSWQKNQKEKVNTATNASVAEKTEEELTEQELAEVDVTSEQEDEKVGEAVLTNAKGNDIFYSIKLEREQTRAENKEIFNEIINNANATEDQKNDAINSIMEIADFAEKENAAETLLSAKGFDGAVVSMEKDNVDVVINKKELTEQEITQIEDIVTRKTGVAMDKIVISTANK